MLIYSLADNTIRPISRAGEQSYAGAWDKNGYIYYAVLPSEMNRLPVSTNNGFRIAGPAENMGSFVNLTELDVTDDGDLMLLISSDPNINTNFSQAGVFKVEVTTHWFDEAKRIAPPSNN